MEEEALIYVAGNPDLFPLEYYDPQSGEYLGAIPAFLERFAQDGLLDKEVSPDGVFRYARREEHGHYLVCTQCHSRIRLQECPLTAMEKQLERETGFSIDRHQLTLYGKCPACRKREK